ncbi:MAG: hypothetical protein AMJ41_03655 [candidate division Zixibacteria bacterium DG_27]|nr:MAG: hypothetical protein AMJ41_03655 [candidate division Zixibacteria bacterium DG_27]
MKQAVRLFVLLAICLFLVEGDLFSQTWRECAPAPTARWNPASVVLDGKIYVIGGQDSIPPYSSLNTVEVYDPDLDVWETLAPMPTDRWGLMVAVAGGKIYAIGGQNGSFSGGYTSSDAVEEYDLDTDTWTSKTPMPTPRGWGGCVAINDTIFVFGGYRRPPGQILTVVEKYHPAGNMWYSEPPMPTGGRRTFMTARVGNKVYLIGGWGSNMVQEYDPVAKTWATKTPMPTARGGSGVDVLDGQIHIVGGRGGRSDEYEAYNPATDTWRALNPMPTPREGLVAGVVNGKLYAIAGSAPINQGGLPYYAKNEEASGFTEVEGGAITIRPATYHISQNYPNPFNAGTTIEYELPLASDVAIRIYDLLGREVETLLQKDQKAGRYAIDWNSPDIPSGIYFYKVQAGEFTETKKMLLLR